ncbi:hypothetical protein KEM55_002190 [Ascosphaera atra]|nr:hypothetical protein KEM55_002190 [Ascosphaera atra]
MHEDDPEHFVVEQWLDEQEQRQIFEHTADLRERWAMDMGRSSRPSRRRNSFDTTTSLTSSSTSSNATKTTEEMVRDVILERERKRRKEEHYLVRRMKPEKVHTLFF